MLEFTQFRKKNDESVYLLIVLCSVGIVYMVPLLKFFCFRDLNLKIWYGIFLYYCSTFLRKNVLIKTEMGNTLKTKGNLFYLLFILIQ
jgi:hypothetical protein